MEGKMIGGKMIWSEIISALFNLKNSLTRRHKDTKN